MREGRDPLEASRLDLDVDANVEDTTNETPRQVEIG